MEHTYSHIAIARLYRGFRRTWRAYFARPDLLTAAHDTQLAGLARALAHEALTIRPDLCPGWARRY